MIIYGTLYRNYETTWRIRISPRKPKTDIEPSRYAISKFRPTATMGEMLIFDPVISLTIRYTPQHQDKKSNIPTAAFPIHMMPIVIDALKQVYEALSDEKLYAIRDGRLYIDHKTAFEQQRKISIFSSHVIFRPTLIRTGNGEDMKGIVIGFDNYSLGHMKDTEVKELYSILETVDYQTYSIIATMLAKYDDMDKKLNLILRGQDDIKQLLGRILSFQEMQTSKSPIADTARTFLANVDPSDVKWEEV